MGVGGSTNNRPGSSTILVASRPPSDLPSRRGTAHELTAHHAGDRPTGSCCSHYRKNHSTITRTVTPSSGTPPPQRGNDIDDEIEEIVANTIDLVPHGNNSDRTLSTDTQAVVDLPGSMQSARRDWEMRGSAAGSGVELRRTLRSNTRVVQKRPSDEISEEDTTYDAKVSTYLPLNDKRKDCECTTNTRLTKFISRLKVLRIAHFIQF